MPSLSDVLGLTENLGDAVGTTVAPALIQAWQLQKQREQANNQAMMAAGAGMLAGNKGNYGAAGPAIGAGVGAGVETYQAAVQAQQLAALKHQQMLNNALQQRQLSEYRKGQLEVAQAREHDLAAARTERAADKRDVEWQRHLDRADALEQRAAEAEDRNQQAQLRIAAERENHLAVAQYREDSLAQRRQAHEDAMTIAEQKGPQKLTTAQGVFIWDKDQEKYVPAPSSTGEKLTAPTRSNQKGAWSQFIEAYRTMKADHIRSKDSTLIPLTPEEWLNTEEGSQVWDQLKSGSQADSDAPKFKLPEGFGQVEITR